MKLPSRWGQALAWVGAVVGPAALTVILFRAGGPQTRDYVFLYLGLVAALGALAGLWPALVAAGLSFLFVDYFFVPPIYAFTIADEQDIVNLLAFIAMAVVVGLLASGRRRAQLRTESLARNLRHANAELLKVNKEQAAAAQAALIVARSQEQVRALQELDRSRREMLANVSHELRTPLGTILAESTSPPAGARGQREAQRRLAAIAAEAQRLKMLVDDMLDLAVIEAGTLELHLEPTRLSDAVEAAVERLHHASPEREVQWDEDDAAVDVLADWGRLLQVLDNLLSNADRFAPVGTPIEVAVHPAESGLVAVLVRDHGPGIDPRVRPRLFERFVHGPVEDGGPQPAGTGLGLAIVKGIVEAHAGSVELEETGGSGASFRFTLPLAEEEGA